MISLTEKDADFIANIAREEVHLTEETFNLALAKMNDIYKTAKKLSEITDTPKQLEGFYSVQAEYTKSLKEMEIKYQETLEKWSKVISLMYTGSENG